MFGGDCILSIDIVKGSQKIKNLIGNKLPKGIN